MLKGLESNPCTTNWGPTQVAEVGGPVKMSSQFCYANKVKQR